MDLVLCKVTARVNDEQYEPTLGSNSVMHSHLPKVFFISFERTLFRLEISKVSRHSKLKHIHNMNFCNTYFYRLVLPVLRIRLFSKVRLVLLTPKSHNLSSENCTSRLR